MVETMSNLDRVYAKWESKNPHLSNGSAGGAPLANGGVARPPAVQYDPAPGRQAWKARYGEVASPPVRRGNKRWGARGRSGGASSGLDPRLMSTDLSMAYAFKTTPLVRPDPGPSRPFPARCCYCMPESRNSMFSDAIRFAGLHNILCVPTRYSDNPWRTRTFYHVSFCLQRSLVPSYADVTSAVLTSPRLATAIDRTVLLEAGVDATSKTVAKIRAKEESRARAILKRMKAGISNRLVRFTGWFLHKLFSRLHSSILVHRGQLQLLETVCKRRVPVIFLPTHRSHLDYILMTFILFNFDLRAPHVAAGDNLLIPFFGSLMRGLGGFFIRRKLDQVAGKKDYVYRAVLQTYMEELLRSNEYMEFFIEGGRTRSGKALHPKGGLLSVLVDSFNSGIIPDAYIVPVSISYDKLVDGNFVNEQLGKPKVRETFWRAIVGIYRVFMGHYGVVRVDFSQPFSLREFLKVSKVYPRPERPLVAEGDLDASTPSGGAGGDVVTPPADPSIPGGAPEKGLGVHGGVDSGSLMDLVCVEQREVVQSLAEHVVYVHARSQAITSVQMLAALLVFTHRQGATLAEVHASFDALKSEILQHDRDVSFAGDTPHIVEHARRLLGDKLVRLERPGGAVVKSNQVVVKGDKAVAVGNGVVVGGDKERLVPVVTLPHVFELSYYANVVSTVFATESVLVNALYGMADREAWTNRATAVRVSMRRLIVEASELCDILRFEFLFVPPCLTTTQVVTGAFDQLRNSAVLIPVDTSSTDTEAVEANDRLWARRFAATLNNDDDSDSDDSEHSESWNTSDELYQLSREEEARRRFWMLKAMLAPLLETYLITAAHLVLLLTDDMPEKDFIQTVHRALKDRATSGLTRYAESASVETLRTALQGLRHINVVMRYEAASVAMVSLTPDYQQRASLDRFTARLESYCD